MDPPDVIVTLVGLTETTGVAVTLTVTVLVQPPVSVTVYVVVVVGLAVTLAPVVADRPVDGAHVYPENPEAVRPVDVPLHMLELAALTAG